jgi:uncharacterized protein (TIRG00374 family)
MVEQLKPHTQVKGNRPKAGRWQLAFKVLLSVGLLVVVFLFVDFSEMFRVVARVNVWLILAGFGVLWIDRALMAYKWRPLLQVLKVHVPYLVLLQIYSVAPLVGMLVPLPISQEAFRMYSLSQYGASLKAVLASIIVERMIGFIAMLVLASISLGIALYLLGDAWPQFAGVAFPLVAGSGAVLALLLAAITIRRDWARKIVGKLSRFAIMAKLLQLSAQLAQFKGHRRTVAAVTGWTFLEQMVPIILTFVMVRALQIDASFIELVAIVPLVVLANRIPISFDGLGVQEGLYVGLFALAGVSVAEALILSTLMRIVGLLAALPWGLHYILGFKGRKALAIDIESSASNPLDEAAQPLGAPVMPHTRSI